VGYALLAFCTNLFSAACARYHDMVSEGCIKEFEAGKLNLAYFGVLCCLPEESACKNTWGL